jgi:NitT/TauT family transport system permease protein
VKISTIQNSNSVSARILRKLFAAAFWLALWQVLYMIVRQEILIVSPVCVLQRLFLLGTDGAFWMTVLSSMLRILIGFLVAVLAGTVLAVLTSSVRIFYDLFHPVISIVKATPVASFIILALFWIQTNHVPVLIAFLMVVPVIWGNVENGIKKVDPKLLQMAKCFDFGAVKTFKRVYVPSIMPYFTAACTTGMGLAWKAGIAAEVLAYAEPSIGRQIYNAKRDIETADLFAWTVVVIIMSVILEWLMVKIMKSVGSKYNVSTN